MPAKIIVLGPKESSNNSPLPNFLNVTSTSNCWGRSFSPFLLGPVTTYPNAPSEFAKNVENCWQYSKVYYPEHLTDGKINNSYFEWAKYGFEKKGADRYPKGRLAVPAFSYWNGERLSYIEARRKIYIPKYKEAVVKIEEFERLKELYNSLERLYLWCFDGYNHRNLGMDYEDVINNEDKPMGHSFVLAMILESIV